MLQKLPIEDSFFSEFVKNSCCAKRWAVDAWQLTPQKTSEWSPKFGAMFKRTSKIIFQASIFMRIAISSSGNFLSSCVKKVKGRKISWSRKSSNRLMFFSILLGFFKGISPEICWPGLLFTTTWGWCESHSSKKRRKKKHTCVSHIWGEDCELFEDILVPFTLSALASGTNCWPKRLLLNRTVCLQSGKTQTSDVPRVSCCVWWLWKLKKNIRSPSTPK